MLTAMKTAKKNKEPQTESDPTGSEIDNNEDKNSVVRNASILSKPVSSSQSLSVDNSRNSVNNSPDKQTKSK
ncbi:unnamed protein product [Leptosia nina]|uniref:Uncharacterized protein n=1 Tax=Leptosia nina TaxID=320188 RepID=A0AAV1JTT1_9NEOP